MLTRTILKKDFLFQRQLENEMHPNRKCLLINNEFGIVFEV